MGLGDSEGGPALLLWNTIMKMKCPKCGSEEQMAKMVADGERRAKSLAKKMWDRLGEEFYRKAVKIYEDINETP